jgi:uncharacterized protein
MARFTGRQARFGMMALAGASLVGAAAMITGCEEPKISSDTATVKIAGKTFHLEIAADNAKRMLGMGGRKDVDDDGGMIFVFQQADEQGFVMRDCIIPIDIMYLDGSGRILTMHEMVPEAPRGADEAADKPDQDEKYNNRLKRYPSKFKSQFVIELRGGRMKELGVKENEKVILDAEGLKKLAK